MLTADMLTAEHKQFYEDNGYVVVARAVQRPRRCAATASTTWRCASTAA